MMKIFSAILVLLLTVVFSNAIANAKSATQSIRTDVFAVLEKAQQAQSQGKAKESRVYLDSLKARYNKNPLNDYELAQMWNFYAYAYLVEGDYVHAINAFKKVLNQKNIPTALAENAQYTLAQLFLQQGNYKEAITLLESWFLSAQNPKPEAYILLAKSYMSAQHLDNALINALAAFDLAKNDAGMLQEDWYVLLQYIYAEQKNYRQQEKVLIDILNRWPKKNYWLHLYAVYTELADNKKQLAVLELMYEQNYLDNANALLMYAQSLAANNNPLKAAKVVERGLFNKQLPRDSSNLKRVAEYLRLAQEPEKALPYYIEVAEFGASGDEALQLGLIYLQLLEYPKAVEQLKTAIQKGGKHNVLNTHLLLGQAYFEQKQYVKAQQVFKALIEISAENPRIKKKALDWLKYIDAELKHLQEMHEFVKK
jgi:tetratricopeptide (TPR) repeat protein